MHDTDVDETDDLPVWSFETSEAVAPGLLAVERLGVGTRCETWLAWSTELWHPVVVKLARPHQRRHPRAIRSLRREADALSRLGHPGAPRLLGDATAATIPHVVLEYVDGASLADLVDESGPLTAADVALLGCQVLSVLRTLHANGLAHVDVKPENVLVRDGRPFLVDFGSARSLGSPQPAGCPVGTPGYAAPEMEACEPISAGMDVFGVRHGARRGADRDAVPGRPRVAGHTAHPGRPAAAGRRGRPAVGDRRTPGARRSQS